MSGGSITKVILDRIDGRIRELVPDIIREMIGIPVMVDKVRGELISAGAKWERSEDRQLEYEFEVAMQTIAENHGRTAGAI